MSKKNISQRTEPKKIVMVQGHPDPNPSGHHLCHGLAEAYRHGAHTGGHSVSTVTVSTLDFPLLRTQAEWVEDDTPAGLRDAQKLILEADHMVLVYPLWLGGLPALTKGFLEQVLRPSLAVSTPGAYPSMTEFGRMMKGTSARVIVTMGMSVAAYRFFYFAHSLKNLERNILKFVGFAPVRHSLFGMVESAGDQKRKKWLEKMKRLGAKGI